MKVLFAFLNEVVEELIGGIDPLSLAVVSIGLEEIGMLHGSNDLFGVARELSAIPAFGDGTAPFAPSWKIFSEGVGMGGCWGVK
jgi:hypothetical protein